MGTLFCLSQLNLGSGGISVVEHAELHSDYINSIELVAFHDNKTSKKFLN